MKKDNPSDENKVPGKPEDNPGFIQDFIEIKKLQNKILQELIDKLKQTENSKNPQTNQK